MYNNKIAKKLKMNKTIDLKYINAREYCDKIELSGTKNKIIDKAYIIMFYVGVISTLFVLFYIIIPQISFGASNEQKQSINEEYEYYGVDNYRDYARKLRIETCERVGKEKLGNITKKQIEHCATMNTLITGIESGGMTSRRCVEDNNCKGLKGWNNGKYGFLKFETKYKQNLYFAEKWFTYHYKKNLFTLVYGFKQKDGSYKYGWTYTQQDTYLQFLRNKYSNTYKEIKNLVNYYKK